MLFRSYDSSHPTNAPGSCPSSPITTSSPWMPMERSSGSQSRVPARPAGSDIPSHRARIPPHRPRPRLEMALRLTAPGGRGSVPSAVLRLALSAVVERIVAPAAAFAVGLVKTSRGGRVVEPVAGGHVPAGAITPFLKFAYLFINKWSETDCKGTVADRKSVV